MPEENEAVLEALTRRLTDEDPAVRRAAAESLERLDTYRLLDDLLGALDSPDPGTVVRTLYALGELRHERALGGLIKVLRHARADFRAIAARLLGGRPDPRAMEPLVELLDDPNPEVRMVAVDSLGNFEDRRLTGALLAQLQDPDPELRGKVVEALERLGDARAADALTPLLEDPDPGVRRRVASALGHLEVGGTLSG